jgi:hypothetical protein
MIIHILTLPREQAMLLRLKTRPRVSRFASMFRPADASPAGSIEFRLG